MSPIISIMKAKFVDIFHLFLAFHYDGIDEYVPHKHLELAGISPLYI